MDQDPNKPVKGVEMGVPVDKMPYANAPMGVPVAAPAAGYPPAPGYPPPPYNAQAPPPYGYPQAQAMPPYGHPQQVDAYGRPIVTAQPMAPVVVPNNANIQRDAQGNALCRKCGAPYPLPAGCTSFRYVCTI
jgi:hypothetical protein